MQLSGQWSCCLKKVWNWCCWM